MRRIIFEISEADNGLMIKEYLKSFGVSSALLTKLKQTENGIMINGKFAKAIEHIETASRISRPFCATKAFVSIAGIPARRRTALTVMSS